MFDMSAITRSGASFSPQKILIYGVQGLGKTTFGATFDAPILLRTEDGAGALDIPTFPLATEYGQIMQALASLHDSDHQFKTLILDSLDWLEPLVLAWTCKRLAVKGIDDIPYGKGYAEADADWRAIMGWLDALRHNKNMTIVLIAHSEIKRFSPPDSPEFDRYQIKLQRRAWGLWQEWADMVLFCNYKKNLIAKDKNGETFRADGIGERIIYTEERPAFCAKNRWGLPAEISVGSDKTWTAFHAALSAATKGRYTSPATNETTVKEL